jgi:hypothetical protein
VSENARFGKDMSGWVVERRRQTRSPNAVEARKPRRVSARSGMQYSHTENGLREKTCPGGAADERRYGHAPDTAGGGETPRGNRQVTNLGEVFRRGTP